MNNPQTPLEKLISDKQKVLAQCKLQEQKLNEDFSYIQENAGSLLISGLSSILFPGSKHAEKGKGSDKTVSATAEAPAVLSISDYFSIAKGMIPLAWEVIQPIIMTWGINKAKNWFINHLFKKKK